MNLAKFSGLTTPFGRLNETLTGGLRKGEFYVIGANQGTAKRLCAPVCSRCHGRRKWRPAVLDGDGLASGIPAHGGDPRPRGPESLSRAQIAKSDYTSERIRLARATAEIADWRLPVSTKPSITPEYIVTETKRRRRATALIW